MDVTITARLNERTDAASVDVLDAIEREAIVQALTASGGNVSRAAASLGIHRQSLQRKIRRYRLR